MPRNSLTSSKFRVSRVRLIVLALLLVFLKGPEEKEVGGGSVSFILNTAINYLVVGIVFRFPNIGSNDILIVFFSVL